MAFFKFRKSGGESDADFQVSRNSAAAASETIDALRRRARHRLIGAAVLVLIVVIGFPLIFNTQPRPIPVDAAIVIPDRDEVAPLRYESAVAAVDSLDGREEVIANAPPQTGPVADTASVDLPSPGASAAATAAAAKAARAEQAARLADEKARQQQQARDARAAAAQAARAKAQADQQRKQQQQAEEAARARAILEGSGQGRQSAASTTVASATTTGGATEATAATRFVVQIGAFSESGSVTAARQAAQKAGVATYVQEVQTANGTRTRVRAGPYNSREAADQAAARLKQAGVSASVIAL
ncbi:MAG: SPOR domain-containing protein [Burkholderiaceae bacterium]|jgi:DedD protein|nr:SPOR domain-containing protein [Burkholderiaceae bacterium]